MKIINTIVILALALLILTSCEHEHIPAVDEAVPATCTATGLTEGSHCSECKLTITPQTVTPKTAHAFVDGKCSICETSNTNIDGLTLDSIFDKDYNILKFLTLSNETTIPLDGSSKRGVGEGEKLYKGKTDLFGVEGELYVAATSDRITYMSFYVDAGHLVKDDAPFSKAAIDNQAKNTVNIVNTIINTLDKNPSHSYEVIRAHAVSISDLSITKIQLFEVEDFVRKCYPTVESERESNEITIRGKYKTNYDACDYAMAVSLSQYDTPLKLGHVIVLNIDNLSNS